MKEKNGLDRNVFQNFRFNYEDKESKDRKKMRQKMIKFVQNAPKCKNFTLKQGEMRSQIYWCKKTNKACGFANCPKNNNKDVND